LISTSLSSVNLTNANLEQANLKEAQLNDVDLTTNPYEANFGIYRVGDYPKPIRDLLAQFKREWPNPPQAGTIKVVQDPAGLAMCFQAGDKIMLSGGIFQDDALSWRPDSIAHCFITCQEGRLIVKALGKGHLTITPQVVIPGWGQDRGAVLYQIIKNTALELANFSPTAQVSWSVLPGATYRLDMAAPITLTAAREEPEVVPNPGEHVVLLPDSDATLQLALPYVRKFAPDLSFAPQEVVGRWPYVTVIATPGQISDEIIAAIKASGAQIVDRITAQTTDALANLLAELVKCNRRFLSFAPTPPVDDSPIDSPSLPQPDDIETYLVQPGDSLSKIAYAFYGQSSLWTAIFESNRDLLDDPGLIRPGMQLKIPLLPNHGPP